jgi:hypothetical protein
VPEIWGHMYNVVSRVQKVKMGISRATKKGAKKLVSSDVAKILEKESSGKIREIFEKTMFTPIKPIKATSKSYCYCLVIRTSQNRKQVFSDKILPDCQQIFSNISLPNHKQQFCKVDRQWVFSYICSPNHKRRFSNKMSKIASN